jgi:hypothetical protein
MEKREPDSGKLVGIKKTFSWLLMALMAALIGFSTLRLPVASTASAQDRVTPFVLDTEVYGFEQDPHGSLGFKTTFARRSDGASARVENVGPITLGISGRRVTFMDGRSVTVVDAFRTKTTWRPVPPQALASFNAQRLRATPDCVRTAGEVRVGEDTVAGQGVVVVERELPTAEGQGKMKETDWRAPELACPTLSYKVEQQQADGSWWLRTEGRVVSLKLEEPDPKLFDDGAGYTEAKPSEIQRKLREIQGIPVDDATWSQEAEQMDKAYPRK